MAFASFLKLMQFLSHSVNAYTGYTSESLLLYLIVFLGLREIHDGWQR